MGASMLRKKIQEVGLPVTVTNMAIKKKPAHVDMVITHQDLTDRARQHAPNAEHISLNNFLDRALYNQLVTQLLAAKRQTANDSQLIKASILAANDDSYEVQQPSVFQLQREHSPWP